MLYSLLQMRLCFSRSMNIQDNWAFCLAQVQYVTCEQPTVSGYLLRKWFIGIGRARGPPTYEVTTLCATWPRFTLVIRLPAGRRVVYTCFDRYKILRTVSLSNKVHLDHNECLLGELFTSALNQKKVLCYSLLLLAFGFGYFEPSRAKLVQIQGSDF